MALNARQAGCAHRALWLTLNRASSKTIQFTQPSREKTVSEKIWLNSYPADMPAYHNLGHTITYAELERLSRDFAAFLQGLPGMAKGERVAIMSPNLLQYPVALCGILRAGMTVMNVNPLYTPRELEHQLNCLL